MEVSNRLDWIAERFSEDSMLARKTGEIGGDTGGFGKVSQAADMLLSAVEELHQDAMGHIHQESIREEPEMCSDECCGKTIKECDCGPDCQHCDCYEKKMSEGYQTMPSIDRDRYDEIKGLEGPFMTLSGKVVYYDPKEGKYYDRDSDMYLDYDEWKKYDSKPDWASKEEDVSESLTRQHFQMFANVLRDIENRDKREDHAEFLIRVFKQDNEKFDKDKFLKAADLITQDSY